MNANHTCFYQPNCGQNRKEKRGFDGLEYHKNAVDGSEIRRSPVEVGSLSHDLQGFIHPNGGWPWDFFQQQSQLNMGFGCFNITEMPTEEKIV